MNCDDLVSWFRKSARPMPWRDTLDPYKIWISEVMLQQTQVATVIPYFKKFLSQFPTLRALANSPEAQVLAAWSGLGYYSRARNLHRGAKFIIEEHRGAFPQERDVLLEVPGIGPYTAGAVLSIAFNLPVPLVDGNVQRVFARYLGEKEAIQESSVQKKFWAYAALLVVRSNSPREFNQALMELGATICTKTKPLCGLCPIQAGCVAYRTKAQHRLPVKKARKKPTELFWAPMVVSKGEKVLLVQNKKGEWWAGMWDIPRKEFSSLQEMERFFGGKVQLQRQKHTVTTHKIVAAPVFTSSVKRQQGYCYRFVSRREAITLGISSLTRKILCSLESSSKI